MSKEIAQTRRNGMSGKSTVAVRYPAGKKKTRRRKTKITMGIHSAGNVVYLCLIIGLVVFACIQYLNRREALVVQNELNEQLASQLNTLQNENDALSEYARNSIDWNYIRETAINEYGLKSAVEDQIVWYHTNGSSGIRQYEEIPS